jgi:hypothetical protein
MFVSGIEREQTSDTQSLKRLLLVKEIYGNLGVLLVVGNVQLLHDEPFIRNNNTVQTCSCDEVQITDWRMNESTQ